MAIYRPQRPKWRLPAAAAAAGLAVGLLAGYSLWGRREPDPAEAIRRVRAVLRVAAGTLEVVEVEYAESVVDGQVIRSPEYRGSVDALARSRARYAEVAAGFGALDPAAAERAEELYRELGRLVAARAHETEVGPVIEELIHVLTGPAGG